jgi:formate/nitrite transporter FocA (FNT family)
VIGLLAGLPKILFLGNILGGLFFAFLVQLEFLISVASNANKGLLRRDVNKL